MSRPVSQPSSHRRRGHGVRHISTAAEKRNDPVDQQAQHDERQHHQDEWEVHRITAYRGIAIAVQWTTKDHAIAPNARLIGHGYLTEKRDSGAANLTLEMN